MSRLLNLYVMAAQELHGVSSRFLGRKDRKVPFIIGVAGSVAVGKSTTARVLRALLARWPDHPRVDLITTDGFLLPNAELERRGIMNRKGFPGELRHRPAAEFPRRREVGRSRSSRRRSTRISTTTSCRARRSMVERPDILIVEGLNVLQPARLPKDGEAMPFVSDFFDFSIYIDADPKVIEEWYVARFMRLRSTAFRDPGAYFHRYASLTPGRGGGARAGDLALDQPEEPRGEHPADPAAGAARSCARARIIGSSRCRCASCRGHKKMAASPGGRRGLLLWASKFSERAATLGMALRDAQHEFGEGDLVPNQIANLRHLASRSGRSSSAARKWRSRRSGRSRTAARRPAPSSGTVPVRRRGFGQARWLRRRRTGACGGLGPARFTGSAILRAATRGDCRSRCACRPAWAAPAFG